MKVYAICTTLDAGMDCDKERMLDSGIKVGDKIRLEEALVGGWHTDVWLLGYHKSFNSVFFEYEDENGNPYNIYEHMGYKYYDGR